MKKIFIFLFAALFIAGCGNQPAMPPIERFSATLAGSSSPIDFTKLVGDYAGYGRGAEQWGTTNWDGTNVPLVPAGNATSLNSYQRFTWGQIETAQGQYSFSDFDGYVNRAILKKQMFSFGVMSVCSSCQEMPTYGYPTYLHNLMTAESLPDWKAANGVWVPNWNSPSYLTRYATLLQALASHINSMSYNGTPYKSVIYCDDIRGFGDFGEWHTYGWTGTEPAGRTATAATLIAIIDANRAAFPNNQLMIPMGVFDPGHSSLMPASVSSYALSATNTVGHIGWRRDNIGDPDYNNWLSASVLQQYKVAPVGGEPNNSPTPAGISILCSNGPYCDMLNEVKLEGISMFGNGNYPLGHGSLYAPNVLAAAAAAGYRITISAPTITVSSSGVMVKMDWQNTGNAPVYEKWDVVYQLRNATGQVIASAVSGFHPRLFLPGSFTSSDVIPVSGLSGTLGLFVIIQDPAGYKNPFTLAMNGRGPDGSYYLKAGIVLGSGMVTPPPDTTVVTPPPVDTITAPKNCDTVILRNDSILVRVPRPTVYDTTWQVTPRKDTIKRACPPPIVIPPISAKTVSIYTNQTLPSVTETDGKPLELGIKFTSSVSGYITGIRFYKTKGNTGSHTAELYNSSGSRLASIAFTGESDTGWQTAIFGTPVAILAGATYIAAYFSSGGFYTSTSNQFKTALANSPLTALANGGVYLYTTAPAFPTQVYSGSGYWVDFLFIPGK